LGVIRLLDITVDIPVCSIFFKKNWHSFSGVFDVQPSTPYPETKVSFHASFSHLDSLEKG
jgi:hypothetical protein